MWVKPQPERTLPGGRRDSSHEAFISQYSSVKSHAGLASKATKPVVYVH